MMEELQIQNHKSLDRDDILVKFVHQEDIIWRRNHPLFKNIQMKEQAWERIACQLGITTTEAERRFKSIREKYRRRKILLERDSTNNVEHSKLKRWDLYDKLGFLDDFMIPRNGSESLGTVVAKPESVSSENISSTNDQISIHRVPISKPDLARNSSFNHHSTSNLHVQPHLLNMRMHSHHTVPQSYSRSSQSTPSPSTTTANITTESIESNVQFSPIVKMEVPDDSDNESDGPSNVHTGAKSCETGNFNYVGDYIAAELNKLPLGEAFVLKNILIREVLNFSEKLMMEKSSPHK